MGIEKIRELYDEYEEYLRARDNFFRRLSEILGDSIEELAIQLEGLSNWDLSEGNLIDVGKARRRLVQGTALPGDFGILVGNVADLRGWSPNDFRRGVRAEIRDLLPNFYASGFDRNFLIDKALVGNPAALVLLYYLEGRGRLLCSK